MQLSWRGALRGELLEKSNLSISSFALTVALLGWLVFSQLKAASPPEAARADFQVYYQAARRLIEHKPLYARSTEPVIFWNNGYVYLPLAAILLKPLAHMSPERASKIWCYANIAECFLAVLCFAAMTRSCARNPLPLLFALVSIARFYPLQENLMFGQANVLLLAATAAMFWAAARNRWMMFATLLALAAMWKIWMIGLAIVLIMRRAWPALILLIALTAVLGTASFYYVGWDEFHYYLIAQPTFAGQQFMQSHSIQGMATYYFSHSEYGTVPLSDSRAVYWLVIGGLSAAVLAMLAMIGWQKESAQKPERAVHQLSLALAALMLLIPSCSNGNLAIALPIVWVIVCPELPTPAWAKLAAIAAYVLLSRIAGDAYFILPAYRAFPRSLALAHGFAGLAILAVITLFLSNRQGSEPDKQA